MPCPMVNSTPGLTPQVPEPPPPPSVPYRQNTSSPCPVSWGWGMVQNHPPPHNPGEEPLLYSDFWTPE